MQLLSNNFAEFGNSILNKYNGFGHYYEPLSLVFLQDMETGEEQQQPVINQTYINEIHYLKQENHIYEKNISFLINLMEKNVVQKVTNTVNTQIQKIIAQELPMVQETVVNQIASHIYDELTQIKQDNSLQQIIEEKVVHYLVEQNIDQSKKLQIARNIINIVHAQGPVQYRNKLVTNQNTLLQENRNHQELVIENHSVTKQQSISNQIHSQTLVENQELIRKNNQVVQGITNQFMERIHAYTHQETNPVSQRFYGSDRVYLKEQNQDVREEEQVEQSSSLTHDEREEKKSQTTVDTEVLPVEVSIVPNQIKTEIMKEIVMNTMKEVHQKTSHHNFYLQDRRVIKQQLEHVVEQYLQKEITENMFQQLVENQLVTYSNQVEHVSNRKEIHNPVISNHMMQNITALHHTNTSQHAQYQTIKELIVNREYQIRKRLEKLLRVDHVTNNLLQNINHIDRNQFIDETSHHVSRDKVENTINENVVQSIHQDQVLQTTNHEVSNSQMINHQMTNHTMTNHQEGNHFEQFHESISNQYIHESPFVEGLPTVQFKSSDQAMPNVYLTESYETMEETDIHKGKQELDAKEIVSLVTKTIEKQQENKKEIQISKEVVSEVTKIIEEHQKKQDNAKEIVATKEVVSEVTKIIEEHQKKQDDSKEIVVTREIVSEVTKKIEEDQKKQEGFKEIVATKEVLSMATEIIKKNAPDALLIKNNYLENSKIENQSTLHNRSNIFKKNIRSLFQSNYEHMNQSQLTQEFTDNIVNRFTNHIEQINQQYVNQPRGSLEQINQQYVNQPRGNSEQINQQMIQHENVHGFYLSKEYKVEDGNMPEEAKVVVTNQVVTLVKETMKSMEQVVKTQNLYVQDRKQVQNHLEQITIQYVTNKITKQEFQTKLNREMNQYQIHLNKVYEQVHQSGEQVNNQYSQVNYFQSNLEMAQLEQQVAQGNQASVSHTTQPFIYDYIPMVHEALQRESDIAQSQNENQEPVVRKQKEVFKDIQFVKEKTTQLIKENKVVKARKIPQEAKEFNDKEKEYIVRTVEETVDESINQLTRQVYRRIEDKLKTERSRRGLL